MGTDPLPETQRYFQKHVMAEVQMIYDFIFRYLNQYRPRFFLILNQIISVHILQFHFFNIHCNILPFKYNVLVDNTTIYLYTEIVYFVRATCFDLIKSSSGPPKRQIQELFMFHCILGSQMLKSFCSRSVKHISLFMLNLCDGCDIKLEPYLEGQYIKITVYKTYRNWFKIRQVTSSNF